MKKEKKAPGNKILVPKGFFPCLWKGGRWGGWEGRPRGRHEGDEKTRKEAR